MDKLDAVYFNNPIQSAQRELFMNTLAQKFPAERARIQGLVDDAIASIRSCNPKLLLAIASYVLLLYKITKTDDCESLKWRTLEFIQNVLVSHKVDTVESSEEEMQERCVQTIRKIEKLQDEMLPFALYYDLILKQVVPDDKEREFLLNVQMMYNVRGKRDVYFNDRYFRLLLQSQDVNLKRCYGVSSEQVIDGVLKLAHVLFESKIKKFLELNLRFRERAMSLQSDDMMSFIVSSQEYVWEAIKDISDFDVENVTGWPKQLILDLSLSIVSEDQLITHDYQFWPIDDLYIRDKPFILLDTRAYCFDYYTFVDNIYHALFKLCRGKESNHERCWSRAQAKAIESGAANIFRNLLPGAKVFENVRYTPSGRIGDARELDVVVICDGATIVVEAKGIEYIHEPPILRSDKVLSFYRNSAKKAGEQTRKFIDYIADSRTRIIKFVDEFGKIVCEINKDGLGRVFRIGVIADSTNEVLACTKKLQGIEADADGFVCLSLDDLLVYEKYFEHEPMQFLAYLSARTDASSLKQTLNSDELDHLGLYICNPHYVEEIKSMRDDKILMFLEDNRRNLDAFFDSLRNPAVVKPALYLPAKLNDLLHEIWRQSVKDKVKIASLLTGLTKEEKDWLVKAIGKELDTQRCYARASTRNCSSEFSDIGIPVFNLIKIHGSINWRNESDIIKNDIGLPTVKAVKDALAGIAANNFVSTTTTDAAGKVREKTLDEMISEAESKRGIDKKVFASFLEQYGKLVMINPTKRKFKESVIDHHFYELMRQYSNNLEKENTLLMVLGFSFADEHIADITRRAANTNPTLHIVVFCYDDNAGEDIRSNLRIPAVCPNNNIEILTPTEFKKQNGGKDDNEYQDFVDAVTHFDFKTVNDLFDLISNNIVVYGK